MSATYDEVYQRALDDPEGFWAAAAEEVHWYEKWDQVLDPSRQPFYQWFKGGVVNSCYNALDLQVAKGRANQAALIYDSPVTDTVQTFTYRELLDQVLNPSRKIDPKYLTYIVETTAGKVYTGLLARKSDKEVVLRDAKNQETIIPADEVEELVAQRKSLMPELLLKDMTAQQVADLLAFLASLKTPSKSR